MNEVPWDAIGGQLAEVNRRAEERHRWLMSDAEEHHQRLIRRWEQSDARAEERHRKLLERQERSERVFVSALGDIDASIQRNTERLDDMGDAIRANTRAVLTVLNGLEPRSG